MASSSKTPVKRHPFHDVFVLMWRRVNLSYALIASLDDDQLLAIGKQIAKGQTDETVGLVAPVTNAAG